MPTGDSTLKLDDLSNFLTSRIISPISKSITVSEALGSPFNSESFLLFGSNFSCLNFLKFNDEFGLIVETVPFDIRRITFPVGPVFTVCPSKNKPPVFTWFAGKGEAESFSTIVTSPSNEAMIIAPLESDTCASRLNTKTKKNMITFFITKKVIRYYSTEASC